MDQQEKTPNEIYTQHCAELGDLNYRKERHKEYAANIDRQIEAKIQEIKDFDESLAKAKAELAKKADEQAESSNGSGSDVLN